MQFLCAPFIGGLSDRFGRRPVLLTTLFLLSVDYAVMARAPTLAWLVAGRMISGIMGAIWAAANSSIADCIPAEKRGAGSVAAIVAPNVFHDSYLASFQFVERRNVRAICTTYPRCDF